MDNVVQDEVARINPVEFLGDFEYQVRDEIFYYIMGIPVGLLPTDMKDVIKLFWNERLN